MSISRSRWLAGWMDGWMGGWHGTGLGQANDVAALGLALVVIGDDAHYDATLMRSQQLVGDLVARTAFVCGVGSE